MKRFLKQGQTLVLLLVFMSIATIIVSGAVIVTLVNSTSTGKFQGGQIALDVAESAAENAILRLLRDPNYSGEVPFAVDGGTATASVNLGIIRAIGKSGNFTRTIEVTTDYSNNVLTITSWREKF